MFFSLEVEEAVGRIMVTTTMTTTEVVAGVCLSTVQDQASAIIVNHQVIIAMEWDTEQEVEEMDIHMAFLGWLLLPLTSFRSFESLHDIQLYP